MDNNWPLQRDLATFYGNPDTNHDGSPDTVWEARNLVLVTPPFRIVAAWDVSKVLRGVRVHARVAPSLDRVYNDVWTRFGRSQSRIEATGFHLCGGGYSFRMKRGGTTLSTHSYGCAVDHNPAANPMGIVWRAGHNMMALEIVDAFESEKWVWGGRWQGRSADAMHFQAARVQ